MAANMAGAAGDEDGLCHVSIPATLLGIAGRSAARIERARGEQPTGAQKFHKSRLYILSDFTILKAGCRAPFFPVNKRPRAFFRALLIL